MTAFMWSRPLNSISKEITTQKKLKEEVWWDKYSSDGLDDEQV